MPDLTHKEDECSQQGNFQSPASSQMPVPESGIKEPSSQTPGSSLTRWGVSFNFSTPPTSMTLVLCVIAGLLAIRSESGLLLALAALILQWMNGQRGDK
jgi:hypothetical protein